MFLPTLPPLSLYAHIPWCIKKCPYCDFNSHKVGNESIPEAAYLTALESDLVQSSAQAQGRKIETVFFGGGTPSLMSAQGIGKILDMADTHIGLSTDCEITLEANPSTFEYEKFSDFRQVGVNRLSIGVQSFDDNMLTALGRIHNAGEATQAFTTARKAGFNNINLDLMYGLPKQSPAMSMDDLQQAIDCQPEHLSWYELTIEPNTEFFNKPPVLADDDERAMIGEQGIAKLSQAGFSQYEVSAFSAGSSKVCLHNMNYWQFGDYIGIGAGAHSKITQVNGFEVVREKKTRLPSHYLNRIESYTAKKQRVEEDILIEYMMNSLRLVEGFKIQQACQRTGLSPEQITQSCQKNIDLGLLEIAVNRIKPSQKGLRLLNLCLQNFL